MMKQFTGFKNTQDHSVPIPVQFFTELFSDFKEINELKIILYMFWAMSKQESRIQVFSFRNFSEDPILMESLGNTSEEQKASLIKALEGVVRREIVLVLNAENLPLDKSFFVLNTPQGKSAQKAYRAGRWRPTGEDQQEIALDMERPNIYRLYEENIGPLTPIIADTLNEAERKYPANWIEDAIRIAIANNVRRWRYIEAILQSWQEKGRDGTDQTDNQKDYRRYIEGEHRNVGEY